MLWFVAMSTIALTILQFLIYQAHVAQRTREVNLGSHRSQHCANQVECSGGRSGATTATATTETAQIKTVVSLSTDVSGDRHRGPERQLDPTRMWRKMGYQTLRVSTLDHRCQP